MKNKDEYIKPDKPNAGKAKAESTQLDLGGIFKSSSGTTNPEQSDTPKDVPAQDATDGATPKVQPVEDTPHADNVTPMHGGLDTEDDPKDTPFPLHCLPDVLRDMVNAIHESRNVDKSSAAVCALGMLNTTLGRGIYMEAPTGRRTYAKNAFWIGIESGTGKSSMYKPLYEPISLYQSKLQEEWAHESTHKESRLTNLKKQLSALKGGDERQDQFHKLHKEIKEIEKFLKSPPQLVADDTTDPALEDLLNRNNTQISINTSEGRKIGTRILYGGEKECLGCQTYLSLFSPEADDLTVNRSSEGGRNYTLKNAWGNSVVMMQPEPLQKIVQHHEAIESGLTGRLNFCIQQIEESVELPKPINPEAKAAYNKLLTDCLETYRSGNHGVPIKISDKQFEWLIDHKRDIARRINSGELCPIREIARRWTENIYKIIPLLHVAKYGVHITDQELDWDILKDTAEICEWFHNGQQRALAGSIEDKSRELGKRIEQWIADQDQQGKLVTLKQVYDKFRIPKSEALSCLEPYFQNYTLTQYEVQQRGRKSTFLVTQESVTKLMEQYPDARIAA